MPNWKAPGHDGVQGFWIRRLDKMHKRIATQDTAIFTASWKMKTYFHRSKRAARVKVGERRIS